MAGWIKIHRKLSEWEWYTEPNTFRLFMHLLLHVNHEEKQWRGATIPAGSILTGRHSLSEKTGLTERQVRTALKNLKSTGEVTSKTSNKYSIISIVKWKEYQTSDQQSDQPPTSKRPASDQQVTTTKECKNVKEHKEGKEVVALFEQPAKKVADYLHKKMLEEIPEAKSEKPETWIKDIERAMRIDGRTEEELIAVIDWMHSGDKFWVSNVRSGKKLRDKYLTMLGQMRRPVHINGSRLSVADHNKAAAEDAKRAILERSARNA